MAEGTDPTGFYDEYGERVDDRRDEVSLGRSSARRTIPQNG
jgi:hypothetical protein